MEDDKKIKQIQKLLDVAEGNLHSARNLLLDILGGKKTGKVDHKESAKDLSILDEGKVIEGVFDGEQMVAPDGKKYPVPANYASKSKLVEGDTLKLTIADDGSLIYKQINPIERKNLIGTLSYDNGNYTVLADGKSYKVLFASVTYYKGEPGSKASVIVPAEAESTWAALESIIHDHDGNEKSEPREEKPQSPSPIKSPEEKPKEEVDAPENSAKKDEVTTKDEKVVIPEENREILEEVKEKFSERNEDGTIKEADKEASKEEKPKATPTRPVITETEPDDKETKITEDMTIKEASQASATTEEQPKAESTDEHPDIKNQSSPIVDEPISAGDGEKNSLGEESPTAKDGGGEIKELEI